MSRGFITNEAVDKMTMEQAQEAVDMLNEDTGVIAAQLREAVANQRVTGEYADAVWFSKATNALKAKRRVLMRIQHRMKQMKRAAYEGETVRMNVHSYECCFVKMARTLLSDEAFSQIEESARELSMES